MKVLYENCAIHDPDGKLLSYVNRRKFNWYITKGIATEFKPDHVKLNYFPDVKDNFLPVMKHNYCVCCGTIDDLTKHHIIPYCYIKFFPLNEKEHNSLNIVALCRSCHNEYEKHATILKEKIAKMYDAPFTYKNINKAISIARTLLYRWKDIPGDRVFEMADKLEELTGKKFRGDKDLEELIMMHNMTAHNKILHHGKIVISKIKNLEHFSKFWFHHFLKNAKPEFLPKNLS